MNLELNYKYLCDTISKNIEKDKEEILIDECDVDNKDKLYLFSPVALILSNIKKEFEKSDFEVFNKGNFYTTEENISVFRIYITTVFNY